MSLKKFKELNTILEQDAIDTSYKYALLRAVSEICQYYSHFMEVENGRVWFPIGLIIEKWLLYYYPIFAYPKFVPQKPSEQDLDKPGKKISFRKQFKKITSYYEEKGGLSAFYSDYRKSSIPQEINYELLKLIKMLRNTITRYPMKHLGYSVAKDYYTIFNFLKGKRIKKQPVTPEMLINTLGKFSISQEYFEIFNTLGGFISGEYSILKKWAEFTVTSDRTRTLNHEKVLGILREHPITERGVNDVKKFFEYRLSQQGYLDCVWSGNKIKSKNTLHIDHVIPFSIWKNNDLWNLLPSHRDINLKKRDYIPSLELLEKRKTAILKYWEEIRSHFPERFDYEIRIALTGFSYNHKNLLIIAYSKLVEKVDNLIEQRGFLKWC